MNLSEPTIAFPRLFENEKSKLKSITFSEFVFRQKFNRALFIITSLLVILSFCVFKYIYPYPGFINGDSYQYIGSAFYNLRVDFYPIGYPKFIRLFSVFSYNDTSLVTFQYLFFEVAVFMFLYSLFYFFNSSKWVRVALLILIAPNPVFLFLANYISSDCLFLALSIFWFTSLVWIIQKPTLRLIVFHSIILTLAFMVRYNALFYPLVSLVAFFSNRNAIFLKLCGICLTLFFLAAFVNYTANQFKRITGTKQFSPFSGWQLANNALYSYRFIDSANRQELPVRFKDLDRDVRNYFDSTRDLKRHPQEMLIASTVYMWDSASPLRVYMNKQFVEDSTKGELTRWATVAPLLNDYGIALIKTYPNAYFNYYLWPNFLKFYAPPVEFLEYYSTNVDTIPVLAKQWFWLKDNKLIHRTKDMKVAVLEYYPIFSGTINAIIVAVWFSFLFMIRINNSDSLFQMWTVFTFFWVCNLGFSVLASPIALRFQLFPIIISMTFSLFLLDQIIRRIKNLESTGENTINDNA